MQLENCVNTVIEIVDGHEEIKTNPANYQEGKNDLTSGKYSFFNGDGSIKELKEISLPSKLFFVKRYYDFNYYWKPVDEMIKIRNKASHRGGMTQAERAIIDNAKNNVSQKKAEYFTEFDKIVKRLKDIYHIE